MADGQQRLGALLLEMGVIDDRQLEHGLRLKERSGRRLGRVLVEAGFVKERPLVEALAHELHLDLWDPERVPPTDAARTYLARETAFRARTLPLVCQEEHGRKTIVLATSDPLDPLAGNVVRMLSDRGLVVRWVLAAETEVELALLDAYGPAEGPSEAAAVTVIRGRPAWAPDEEGGYPESEHKMRPSEDELIEALDAALADPPGLHNGESSPEVDDGSKVSIGTIKGGQDEAVLEIIEVAPVDPAPRPIRAAPPRRPSWARAARSNRTNWGELVPTDEADLEATQESLVPEIAYLDRGPPVLESGGPGMFEDPAETPPYESQSLPTIAPEEFSALGGGEAELSSAYSEEAAKVYAGLVRFAKGDPLALESQVDALRFVVAVLIEKGWLEEERLARMLRETEGI